METSTAIERNKSSLRQFFNDVINAGRLDLCDRYLAVDRVDHQDYGLPPGAADGNEGFKKVVGPFCEAFPDLHLDVQFMIAEDDCIMAYISTSGTHTRNFMGAPATDKHFKISQTDIFRFNEEGRVAEHWGVFDMFGILTQLGLLPMSQ